MDDEPEGQGLKPFQRRHLLTSCQYADGLLSGIEAVLVASQSKSPFPKYKPDISPAQAKVVQDYISFAGPCCRSCANWGSGLGDLRASLTTWVSCTSIRPSFTIS